MQRDQHSDLRPLQTAALFRVFTPRIHTRSRAAPEPLRTTRVSDWHNIPELRRREAGAPGLFPYEVEHLPADDEGGSE